MSNNEYRINVINAISEDADLLPRDHVGIDKGKWALTPNGKGCQYMDKIDTTNFNIPNFPSTIMVPTISLTLDQYNNYLAINRLRQTKLGKLIYE